MSQVSRTEYPRIYLSSILSVFCSVWFLSGCNSSSTPKIVHSSSPIIFTEQALKKAIVDSRKFQFQDFNYIKFNQTGTIVVKDNDNEHYGVFFKKVRPFNHGTIELNFRFPISQDYEKDLKIKTVAKEKPNKDNFAGIGFSTANDKKLYMATFYRSGKLTFGTIGEKPLITRQLKINELIFEKTKIKISFMHGHLIIFLDGIPTIRLKVLGVKNVESIAFIARYFPSQEKKWNIVFDEKGIKYRLLSEISKKSPRNVSRYLEEENSLINSYSEKKKLMNIFNISEEFLTKNDGRKIVVSNYTIDSETRRSIFAPAPTKIKYPITIHPHAYLNFGYAIAHPGWENSDGMRFSISFHGNNREKKKLFSHFVDPQRVENRKWFEQRVDLSALEGLSGILIFETLPYNETQSGPINKDELFDFGLWGDPVIYYERESNEQNVILISLDTLRADHLGAYGYFRNTSPNIDALTKKGLLFKNTITQAPWTLPSHMTMLTSLYPSQLGYSLMDNEKRKVKIPANAITIAEVLKKNGYLTAGFTGGANVSRVFGFNKGFSLYNERWGTEINTAYNNMSNWIQKHQKDKFFLFFHTFEIHEYPASKHEIFTDGINPQDEKNYKQALYDGKIKYVDNYIGRLIEKLRSLNLLDETLIVITSDHGTEFHEHGKWGHGDQLYDEVLLVPLVFHLKGKVPQNVVINNQARVIDIMPTILDVLEISSPKMTEGTSLVPLFNKKESGHLVAFTEATKYNGIAKVVEPYSIRTKEFKYIYYPQLEKETLAYLKSKEKKMGYSVDMYNQGEGELYNLLEDPGEQNNIIKLKSSLADDFRKEIKSFRERNLKKDITKGKVKDSIKIDSVTLERLKALGYIQ